MSFELLFFCIFAGGWLAGRLAEALRLPGVLGMTLWGAGLGAIIAATGAGAPAGFAEIAPFIKSLALVVILLRAGLGLSRKDLSQAGLPAILMTFVPCVMEGLALMIAFRFLMGFPWTVAGLTGFMLAAVSPAVVVPAMLEFREKGLGKRNGVTTVILAGSSADDVFAITIFTVFLGLSTGSSDKPLGALAWMPLSLLGGVAAGLLLGFLLSAWFRKRHSAIRATEKALLIISGALFLVRAGDWLHLAALLGVMTMGLVILERAELVAHELAAKLSKVWVFAQIALFVIIGLSLDLGALLRSGPLALLALLIGLVARSLGVLIATAPSRMSPGERLFCVIAYLPKATVQAALGGVALAAGLEQGREILAIAVLAIVVTAPLGLVGIRLSAPRLLPPAD